MSELDDRLAALTERAVANLSKGASSETSRRVAEELPKVAALLALEWITGERRFETQSQQSQHWLAVLYENVFQDEEPDGGRLFRRFDLPLQRSQYLARALTARFESEAPEERAKAARAELRGVLESVEAKVPDVSTPNGDEAARLQEVDLSISRAGYDQLAVIFDEVASAQPTTDRTAPPSRRSSTASLVYFRIRGRTVLDVLEHLRKDSS